MKNGRHQLDLFSPSCVAEREIQILLIHFQDRVSFLFNTAALECEYQFSSMEDVDKTGKKRNTIFLKTG